MECRTKEDFSALATSLSDLVIQKHSSSKHYASFIDELVKALAQPLKADEVGKVRASMAQLAIDKGKAEKANVKGPGGKPPARMVARGREDLSSFGEVLDDDAAAANFDPDEDFVASPSLLVSLLGVRQELTLTTPGTADVDALPEVCPATGTRRLFSLPRLSCTVLPVQSRTSLSAVHGFAKRSSLVSVPSAAWCKRCGAPPQCSSRVLSGLLCLESCLCARGTLESRTRAGKAEKLPGRP